MKRRSNNRIFFIIGFVLIIAALGLTAYNVWDSLRAGDESEKILDQLEPIISRNSSDGEDESGSESRENEAANEAVTEAETDQEGRNAEADETAVLSPSALRNREMPTVEIDGYDYIGIIAVPSVNIELPVMMDWDYTRLRISPCRYSGSYYSDDLVICGHNYSKHFSPIKWADIGADVYFTSVGGLRIHYVIENIETVAPTAISEMVSNDQNSDEPADWDLTLFTCNTGGQTRCAVRCVRLKNDE